MGRKKSISGMKGLNAQSILIGGAKVGGGYLVGRVVSNLEFAQANPMIGVALPIGGAIAAQMLFGKKATEVSYGMVASSAVAAVQNYLPEVASKLGLPPAAPVIGGMPWRSLQSPGVAGVPWRSVQSPGVAGTPPVKVRYQ